MGLIKEFIFSRIEKSLKSAVKDVEKDFMREISIRANHFKRRFIKELICLTILLISLIFLAFAILFLLIEYLDLSKTISFAIMGIVLLIIGLIDKFR